MKDREWLLKLAILVPVGVMMIITNMLGYEKTFSDSVKGVTILCAIALFGLVISKFMERFIDIPFLVYLSLSGLILASPISPIRDIVINSTSNVAFLTPTTTLGAFAGISLGKDLKDFMKMGWKYVIITMLVITGTFLGSTLIAQITLSITNVI